MSLLNTFASIANFFLFLQSLNVKIYSEKKKKPTSIADLFNTIKFMLNFINHNRLICFIAVVSPFSIGQIDVMKFFSIINCRNSPSFSRYMNLLYIGLFICTITALTIASFFRDVPKKQLYYRAWLPFDYSKNNQIFWAAYIHQVIAHGFDASLHAAYDTLAPAMMIQTCAQFELLNSRFEKLPRTIKTSKNKSNLNDNLERQVKQNETEKIGNCVEHHIQIIEFSKKNNKIFGTSIFLQYSVSSLVLCMSVLRLSQLRSLSPDLASVFLYLISMISQVFIPCFAGHQLTVESCQVSDAIYSMDWTTLTTSTQKSLVLIMNRSQKPVRFISGYVIPLSMTSFNNVIRISYSIFNVLHSSSAV